MEKIELTASQAIQAGRVFNDEKWRDMQLPMRVSMWIVKNARETADIMRAFETNRQAVFSSMAEESPVKPEKYIPDHRLGEYQEVIKGLLAEKIEVEAHMIPAQMLEKIMITPKELFAVIYAIAED